MRASRNIVTAVLGLMIGLSVVGINLYRQHVTKPPVHPAQPLMDTSGVHSPKDLDAVQSSKELNPNLLAMIFSPASAPTQTFSTNNTRAVDQYDYGTIRGKVRTTTDYRPPIPKDWESFDEKYAPDQTIGHPMVSLLENGTYQVDELLYSIKLLEKKLNVEYRLNNLADYDPRTRANAFDNIIDHSSVKTDVNVDAPIGAYVGVRLVVKFW